MTAGGEMYEVEKTSLKCLPEVSFHLEKMLMDIQTKQNKHYHPIKNSYAASSRCEK